jgi:hypothetical protein
LDPPAAGARLGPRIQDNKIKTVPTVTRRTRRDASRPLALLAALPFLQGYALYDASGFSYLGYTWNKWGNPGAGTPATVYWSLMPVGTAGSAYCGPGCTTGTGTSTLTLPNFYDWNTQSFRSLSLASAEGRGYIRNALRTWGAAAGLTFIEIPSDSGVPINDAAAEPPATGQIRIGVFEMGFGAPAGAGFAAPPNGFIPNSSQFATGAGDLILNSTYAFQNPPGAEGAPLQAFPAGGGLFLNDLEGLILHEVGHTLGIDHSADPGAVMCGWPHACSYSNPGTYVINRRLEPDDLAAVQVLYGPAADSDGDGAPDATDNCVLAANADQFDGDGDGYGNRCDGDLNNNGFVNAQDTVVFRSRLGTGNAAADLNHNGVVNAQDTVIFRTLLGSPPGPSGQAP